MQFLAHLHITHARSGCGHGQCLTIYRQRQLNITGSEGGLVGEQRMDGIHAVDGCIPLLSAFLLQQPSLHSFERDSIPGSDELHSLDDSHLGGDAIAGKGASCLMAVVVESHLGRTHKVFLHAPDVVGGYLRCAKTVEDNGSECLLIDILSSCMLFQQRQQIVDIFLHLSRHTIGECMQIHPYEGESVGRTHLFSAPLLLFDTTHLLGCHTVERGHGFAEDAVGSIGC